MMKSKKIGTLFLAALMVSTLSMGSVEALGPSAAPSNGKPAVQTEKAGAAKVSRNRHSYTLEEKIRILHGKYDISEEEARNLLKEDTSFSDLKRVCLWSVIAKRPVSEVLALKRDNPWDRLPVLLKVTPQEYLDRNLALRAHQLHSWWGFDEKACYQAMEEGYPMHYVKIATILSRHTGKPMSFFLKDRKASESWIAYCARTLGISEDTYNQWIGEYKNPTWIPGKW